MAKRIESTPKADGFRMPGEFEEQKQIWMLWPERPDNWRNGAKPAQKVFTEVAKAISQFEPVTVCVSPAQYQHARYMLPTEIRVVEMTSNDAWIRDCGPTFVVNDKGDVRAIDWEFNSWGGLVDGLYFPWDQDNLVAQKVCEIEGVDSPLPVDVVEKASILHLVDAVFLVIACGGGIPVVKQGEGSYVGVLAVIDKDYASECLAEIVDAEYLYILTAVDRVCINFNKPDQKEIKEMSCREAEAYAQQGQFAPGSMLPKVKASMKFAASKTGRKAVICSLEKAALALSGKSGTIVKQ